MSSNNDDRKNIVNNIKFDLNSIGKDHITKSIKDEKSQDNV